jgi:hypothetical protein
MPFSHASEIWQRNHENERLANAGYYLILCKISGAMRLLHE